MKRKLALLLAILMILSFIVIGCGKSDDVGKDVTDESDSEQLPDDEKEGDEESGEEEEAIDFGGRTITYTAWFDDTPEPGASEEDDRRIARIEELEEKYNCKVEFVNIPWEEYLEKYITAVMAGDTIGDVVVTDFRWFYPTLAVNGYCTDLKQFEDQGIYEFSDDKWNQILIKACTLDDKIFGCRPGRMGPSSVLYWNKSLFEKESLPNLYDLFFKGEWTWDKMLEIAKKATKDTDGDGKIDQWGLVGIGLGDAFVHSNNGRNVDVSDKYNPKFALDSSEALEALQTWQDFILKHKVVEIPPEGAEWDYPRDSFCNGNIAMLVADYWMISDIKENLKDDFGIVAFPQGPKADGYTAYTGGPWTRTIPSTVKDPEQVAIFDNAYTEPYEDVPEDDWKENYADEAPDKESYEIVVKIIEEGLVRIDYLGCFDEVVQMSYTYNWEIQNGEKTPQVAIEEISQKAQTVIDNSLKRKPEELLEENEDEGNNDEAEEDTEE